MKILFVINPKSGKTEENNLEDLIEKQAEISGFEYELYHMHGGNFIKEISKKIYSYKPQIVAAAGGDGTINLLAALLENTKTALLIIPNGSANGMAKELNIKNIPSAIKLIEDGVYKSIDLLRINNRVCIHLADVGLNARIVKRFEDDPKRGLAIYAKHMLAEIFLVKKYRFLIKCGKDEYIRKAVSLTFANASKYGTGAVINPTGIIDDGKMELIIIKPFPTIKWFGIAWKMFSKTLETSEYVEVIQCTKAHITSKTSTTLQVDGEIIGKVKTIDAEILHKALTIIVPAGN
ncbi:MAG TPA: diacylglycerol kinase family protein [Sphingobacteriaceae bacterium]|nr:diacylglycerol kinase family protein [Sphingobacteriaceae bacterium]